LLYYAWDARHLQSGLTFSHRDAGASKGVLLCEPPALDAMLIRRVNMQQAV